MLPSQLARKSASVAIGASAPIWRGGVGAAWSAGSIRVSHDSPRALAPRPRSPVNSAKCWQSPAASSHAPTSGHQVPASRQQRQLAHALAPRSRLGYAVDRRYLPSSFLLSALMQLSSICSTALVTWVPCLQPSRQQEVQRIRALSLQRSRRP